MKRLFVLLALLAPVAHALGLEDALRAAPSRPDAVSKRLELLNAENDRIRVQSDPLALKMDRLKADQAVALTRAQLQKAVADGLSEIAKAYTGVLLARGQAALAEKGVGVAESGLKIAQIRRSNGSATDLDVEDARVALDKAEQDAEAARNGLGVALANLEGMLGEQLEPDALEGIPDRFLLSVPTLDATLAALPQHPQLLQAAQGLELAGVGVSMLDPSYASASQIESARTQLKTSEQLVAEARRGFQLQARNLVVQAQNAVQAYRVQQDDLANAQQRLRFQKERLANGVIAQVQYDQAELQAMQAELSVASARYGVLTSLLDLQAGTLVPLGGPAVMDAATAVGAPPADGAGTGAQDGND